METRKLPRAAGVYVGAVAAAAALMVVLLVLHSDVSLEKALVFGLFAFLAEQFPLSLPSGSSYSVSFVMWIAAMVAAGPAEAAIAAACGTLTLTNRRMRKTPLTRKVFNASQLVLTGALGGLAYQAAGGPIGQPVGFTPEVLLPLAAAIAVTFPVNTGLVSIAVAICAKRSPRLVWLEEFLPLGPAHVAFALLGFLLASLYLDFGVGALLFLLAPLLIARHAFQGAVAVLDAYDTTVRSVARAIEAKDPYTRGHAERVSQLADMVAREYGLAGEELRMIRYAALLHDVGKLGVSTRVLKKPGKLTADEYDHMKLHPTQGAEILSEIDWLRPALVVPLHHHERFDGGGYPEGLGGDDIPLMARLVTVSDAFDSMTSTRMYRRALSVEQALGELRRCSGTQFDPRAVEALERAVARHGWEPTIETAEEPADARATPA